MKIKLNKEQWERIGKKAGWIKVSQVGAPTKAPVKTPTKTPETTPTTPSTPSPKSPFNPPRPKVLPNPKGKGDDKKKN